MQRKLILRLLPLMIIVGSSQTVQAKTIEVPQEFVEVSEQLGGQYNVCPELIQAICYRESRFTADAEGGGCVGIMQISPRWHKGRMDRLGITDLYDTKQNMLAGTDYLSELICQYEDIGVALMFYNGDSSAGDVLLGSGNLSAYAEEILSISEELERENGK